MYLSLTLIPSPSLSHSLSSLSLSLPSSPRLSLSLTLHLSLSPSLSHYVCLSITLWNGLITPTCTCKTASIHRWEKIDTRRKPLGVSVIFPVLAGIDPDSMYQCDFLPVSQAIASRPISAIWRDGQHSNNSLYFSLFLLLNVQCYLSFY